MKMTLSCLTAAVLAASLFAGCNGPRRDEAAAPAIMLKASHMTMQTGESTRITARTINLVGTQGIKWAVTPTTGRISPESDNGLSAMFTATEPGTYQITASADAGNGRWVEDYTNITVNGMVINNRPMNGTAPMNGNPPANGTMAPAPVR